MNHCSYCMEEVEQVYPDCGCSWTETIASPLHLPPGTVLNSRYEIGRVLGEGGFGITYLGFDLHLNIRLAIKEFFPRELASRNTATNALHEYSGSEEDFAVGLGKFLNEAKHLARFDDHEGIVSVRDFLEANGTAYFVMSYVDGETAKEFISRLPEKKLSVPDAFNLMMPVLDALHIVHEVGLLHRDVSPDNIYVTTAGQVKLLDFGAARQAIQERSRALSTVLKVEYAPVEQFQSTSRQGPWTDIYAAAASIYEWITGKLPPRSIDRLLEDSLAAPSSLGVEISPTQESALLKALSLQPEDRFQKVRDFQEAIGLNTTELGFLSARESESDAVQEKNSSALPDSGKRLLGRRSKILAMSFALVTIAGWGYTGLRWDSDRSDWINRYNDVQTQLNQQRLENQRLSGTMNDVIAQTESSWQQRMARQHTTFMSLLDRYAGWWTDRFQQRSGLFNLIVGQPQEFDHYFLALRSSGDIGKGAIVRGSQWVNRTESIWEVVYGFSREDGIDYYDSDELLYLGARWEEGFKDLAQIAADGEEPDGFSFRRAP